MNRTRAWGKGEHLWNSTEKEGEKKNGLSWKSSVHFSHSCRLAPPHYYPISLLLSVLRFLRHPPSLLSPAPAERLTRADEKGSSVKGQGWAATPRMPEPVQSNKAGCPLVTGCLAGKTGSLLLCAYHCTVPLCYSITMGYINRRIEGEAPWEVENICGFE